MNQPNQNKKDVVKPLTLFLIGLSAGFITAIFPRILPLITQFESVDNLSVLNFAYIILCVVFSLIIGISAIWIYAGSTATHRTLFFAAMGIPALISGGYNVNNTVNEVNRLGLQNFELVEEKNMLLDKLSKSVEIEIDESEEIDLGFEYREGDHLEKPSFHFPFLSSAYAQTLQEEQKSIAQFNPGVQYKSSFPQDKYLTIIESSMDSITLSEILAYYSDTLLIPDLKIIKSKNSFYLVSGDQMYKDEALLNAIEIKNNFEINPKLIKVKSK